MKSVLKKDSIRDSQWIVGDVAASRGDGSQPLPLGIGVWERELGALDGRH